MCVLSIDPRDAIHTVLYSARAAPMLAGSDANSSAHTHCHSVLPLTARLVVALFLRVEASECLQVVVP